MRASDESAVAALAGKPPALRLERDMASAAFCANEASRRLPPDFPPARDALVRPHNSR
jgi:hypothetical protein